MHDIADLESRGLPSVYIATTEFIEASKSQGAALGLDPAVVFIPHPIQDRTDEEIQVMADDALESIIGQITSG